jgi:hypothetical protein
MRSFHAKNQGVILCCVRQGGVLYQGDRLTVAVLDPLELPPSVPFWLKLCSTVSVQPPPAAAAPYLCALCACRDGHLLSRTRKVIP